jgi:hypothetical protein
MLITPPNFGGGGGRYFPSIVVVALGEPGTPVTCCAFAIAPPLVSKLELASAPRINFRKAAARFIRFLLVVSLF